MTHTSLFFQEVTQAVFMLAFNEVTNTRSSVMEVAKRFNMSSATLHEFVARVRGTLVNKITLVEKILLRENPHSLGLKGINKAVYMNGTFLKIKGSTYYLIVAVNSKGTPLCWKLASSRKGDVIKEVTMEVFEQHGTPMMIVTDGNPTYKQVLTQLHYEGIHVSHIHKDKRNRIIIRRYIFKDSSTNYTKEIIGLNHDVFTSEETRLVWVLLTQKKIVKKGGTRGRPKGSKNRSKNKTSVPPMVPPQNNLRLQKSAAKKRRQKNVFTDGCVMETRVNPAQKFLEVVVPVTNPLNSSQPSIIGSDPLQVLSILYPVFHEFKCQYISSNRIESIFSQLDHLFISRDRRTLASVINETSTWLLLRHPFSLLSSIANYTANSFSSRVGLVNLGKLSVPINMSST